MMEQSIQMDRSDQRTSTFAQGLVWFGAAVSIAEILTGTLVAPLGFSKGLCAIVLGHIIGCALLFLAGSIGARTGKSSMETVKISFGRRGSLLFSSLNILQLVGWTAVMIASGTTAASAVIDLGGDWVWSLIIGAFVMLWILVGLQKLTRLNTVAMAALLILTLLLSITVFKGDLSFQPEGSLSFGAAVELSVAMPLSWLPLIADYTRTARHPRSATAVSVGTYFLVSCWMYVIGMGAALCTGQSDIARIMMDAGLGIAALLTVVFSTVTTTFLDVHSAGVSSESISPRLKQKPCAICVCAVGTALAILTPIARFEDFLYLIGSVFAPMIAVVIADYFITKRDSSTRAVDVTNLIIWVVGFCLYRVLMPLETPLGITLPVMMVTSLISLGVRAVESTLQQRRQVSGSHDAGTEGGRRG